MNRIKTSDILDPSIQQPFTGRSLDFLQDAISQTVAALAQSICKDDITDTQSYALYGCKKTSLGGSDYKFDAGFIYDTNSGEVYYFNGVASIAIATAPILSLVITNDPVADPITFTDSISRNVHNVRRLSVSDGALGSGIIDYADLIFLNDSIHQVGAAGEPAYANSYGGAVTFKKDPLKNKVVLQGNMTRATQETTGATAFTLPVGYRPAATKYITISTLCTGSTVKQLAGFVVIDSASGAVYMNSIAASPNASVIIPMNFEFYLD